MRGQHQNKQWFQAMVLFNQKEIAMWKEMKSSSAMPSHPRPAPGACHDVAAASATSTATAANGTHSARLLFLKKIEKAMDVSFQHTIKDVIGVIALYGLKKHVSVYSNHCVCLIGFALVHDNDMLQWIVQKRSLPMRTLDLSMGFISHTDIIMAQKVGMNPHLKAHIYVSQMHGHVLDQTVSHGVYLSERAFGIHLRKWTVQAKSPLHLWIMLRYTLAGFGGTNVPLLPAMCLEQVAMSGIPPEGDTSYVYYDTCMNNITGSLLTVECAHSSEKYFQDFVMYITDGYDPVMNKLKGVEKLLSERDCEWERFPVIYTERSRELWAMLSKIPSLSLPKVETFLRDQFIPKHGSLFGRTPYEVALEDAGVTVQTVDEFCLYQWGLGDGDEPINVHWKALRNRITHCRRQLESSLDGPNPLLCKNPELSLFAKLRQPLLMDSSDGCSDMHHVYPFTGDTLALNTIPSTASIGALIYGNDHLSNLMKGEEILANMASCIHEVTNPLLNISTVVVDVDVEAYSKIVSKVRESNRYVQQFCSELKQNAVKVLQHLEKKCSSLTGLAYDVKHLVFRTEPCGTERAKEGFHHLIVLPYWACLHNVGIASAFIQLLQITRHCMPMVGEQGVTFDNIYESSRHPMRLPFQCKSKGKHALILIHSDYGDAWDMSLDMGSLFIHGKKRPPVLRGKNSSHQSRILIDDISGVNAMSESTEHHRHAVSVLTSRNKMEAKESSFPSLLERFGEDLSCSSLREICTLLENAFTGYIARKFIDKVNMMTMDNTLSLRDITFKWLADKELMAVTKGSGQYHMDVCIAQRHKALQKCLYYICVKRQPQTGQIYAILYEMCYSTNCIASKNNPPYDTGIRTVLG